MTDQIAGLESAWMHANDLGLPFKVFDNCTMMQVRQAGF